MSKVSGKNNCILKWYYDQIFTITENSMYHIEFHERKKKRRLPFANICITSGDILVSKIFKYANKMTDDVMHMNPNIISILSI